MAIINKPDTVIFAGSAPVGEVEQYPEMQRGIAVIFERFQGIPPMEMFNYLLKRFDEKALYLWQQGIPDWAADIDYPQYAVVKKGGSFYHASQNNNNKDPSVTSNAAFWTKWLVSESDLSTLLSNKSNVGHTHDWNSITGKPTTFAPSTHSHDWNSITGKPTTMESYGIVDGIKVVGTAPSQKVGDVIYVIDKACFMRWQTIGSWTGYASDQLGALVAGTTKTPRTNEIDAIGQTVNKSRYPGLWAFAQHNGLVVPSSSWRAGTYYFVDLGGDNFKVPDERNMFIRFTGTDADSANPRELGSYQKGSLFVSDTAVGGFYLSTLAFDSASHLNVGGIDLITTASTDYPGVKVAVSTSGSVRSTADSNLFHFGVTRPTNTAFSPRIVAF